MHARIHDQAYVAESTGQYDTAGFLKTFNRVLALKEIANSGKGGSGKGEGGAADADMES